MAAIVLQAAETSARDAIRRGCAALAASDYPLAIDWLGRAHRLVPNDPTASLLFAAALAPVDQAASESCLAESLRRHPGHRATLLALVSSDLRRGDANSAAARLHTLLSTGAPPGGREFAELAAMAVRESGAPGWVGLSSTGVLQLAGREVTLLVGGVRHPVPKHIRSGVANIVLRPGWREAESIAATCGPLPLIGSPIDVAAILRVEGCITTRTRTRVSGWAWHPRDPDSPVVLEAVGADDVLIRGQIVADRAEPSVTGGDGVARACGFALDLTLLRTGDDAPINLRGPDGHHLPGGPVALSDHEADAARDAAGALYTRDRWRPLPVSLAADPPPPSGTRTDASAGFDLILVLQGAAEEQAACVQSLPRGLARLIAVDIGQTTPQVLDLVSRRGAVCLAASGASIPAALNKAIAYAVETSAKPRHLLLLTEPCIVPPGTPARLDAALRATPATGLASPISRTRPTLGAQRAGRDERLFRGCNAGVTVPLLFAVGPCLALSHDCLQQTGRLRDESYAAARSALLDFTLRARHLGWRTVMACDAFLPAPARDAAPSPMALLDDADAAVLERLHPGIGRLMQEQAQADPGAEARRRVAMAEWTRGRKPGGSVILVTHGQGGGVERRVRQRAAAIRAARRRAIIIRPADDGVGGKHWCVSDEPDATHPDLIFAAPGEFASLASFLAGDRPAHVELHHAASHPQEICGLAATLGIPYEVVVHDFAMICPRVTCLGGQGRYCGEPADVSECDDCIADHGVRIGEAEPVSALRARSTALALGARRVLAPSVDAATRFRRYVPGLANVAIPAAGDAWDDDAALTSGVPRQPSRAENSSVTVCLVGAIGTDKGFDVLLACARDASRRRLNLRFRVVGHTIDDDRLIATGRVFVTGRYEEHEAVALIRAQHADIGFLPSVWPETWCYALSALWQSGLWTLAFALGAQAERIAATGAGKTVPLGLPAGRLNDIFCAIPASAGLHG